MENIFLSIIIPVYNSEKYLKTCLDSVIYQNFKNFEVICINDGSKDNSLQILQEYAIKDNRIFVINQQNTGQGIARNRALAQAKGKYILYLDSDDWLEDEALEKIYDKLNDCPTDILIFNYNRCDGDDTKTKQNINFNAAFYNLFGEDVFTKEQAKAVLFSTSALQFKVYKKELLIKNDIKYAETNFIEDHIFFIKSFLLAESFCCLNDYLVNYRIHGQSTTKNSYKYIQTFKKILYLSIDMFEKYKFSDDKLFEESFLLNRLEIILYYFSITPFKYKRKFFYTAKCIIQYINNKYNTLFFDNNNKVYLFKFILNNSFTEYLIAKLKLLLRIYMV